MKLTALQQDIYSSKICPYCKSSTKIVSETFIYGKEYKGRQMICCFNFPVCDSYIGTHDDGTTLGRLANKELRQWRKVTHNNFFDPLWKSKEYDRSELYEMLADYLELPLEYCHIGFFNVTTLKKVIEWCKNL